MENKKTLNEFAATAICGNDISSSCLYVSALSIIAAGQYAWISLLIVALILFFYRRIYGEVVGAIPLNGGAYNALLNTTQKWTASLAACLTILSYMATAVISAGEAMHYIDHILPHGEDTFFDNLRNGTYFIENIHVIVATIVLLALFMGITIMGISESSKVAIAIFIFHITTLSVLVLACIVYIAIHGFDILNQNFSGGVLSKFGGNIKHALYFGFAAAMLGISGFESSANFVEEQKEGIFPKTLRNMWIVVSVFNPLLALLAISIVSLEPIAEGTNLVAQNKDNFLAFLGNRVGGNVLSTIISIDAFFVLSGAVLTSFVGVGGLVERMALDRILPQFLLKKNKKGAAYMIMIVFFILCVSVCLITLGDIESLAGVYTISFLSVMILFGLGNIMLKIKRKKLPRPTKAPVWYLIVALSATIMGLIGTIHMNLLDAGMTRKHHYIFFSYFIPAMFIILVMLYRIPILKVLLYLIRSLTIPLLRTFSNINVYITKTIDSITSQEFAYFTKGDNIATLKKVMDYIQDNENTKKIKIVTILNENVRIPEKIDTDIDVLDREYPEIDIEFIKINGKFGPELIDTLSAKWNIPKNFMFIASPGDRFPFRIEQLGGVRLII